MKQEMQKYAPIFESVCSVVQVIKKGHLYLFLLLFMVFGFISAASAFPDEATSPGTVEPGKKYIRIISPESGQVWEEGETCTIRWESGGVDNVHISVATGGKDKGLLEDDEGRAAIDATKGCFEWTIPDGFITAFGPEKSEKLRIMVFDTEDFETRDVSEYFTVIGKMSIPSGTHPDGNPESTWVDAIEEYYGAIGKRCYREAYEMLCDCKVVVTDPDGSKVSLGPRPDFETWKQSHQKIEKAEVLQIEETAGDDSSFMALGFRTFKVIVDLHLSEETWSVPSGENTFLLRLARGSDGIIRILDIGTGP